MRKSAAFLFLFLFLQVFFACQIPTAIEIKGTPSIRFAEEVDIGKMFTDLLKDAINKDEKLTIIPCPETEIITYLIHAELFNKEFEAVEHEDDIGYLDFPGMELLPGDIGVELITDKILIDGSEDRMTLPLSEIGSLLEGFVFCDGYNDDDDDKDGGYKTKLYFSNTNTNSGLIEKSRVKIKIEEMEEIEEEDDENSENGEKKYKYNIINDINNIQILNHCSDIEKWKEHNEYDGEFCPSDGVEIDVPITGKDIAISFIVYIPAGETINLNDFDEGNMNVEVVIWLPFKFIAIGEKAELSFPDGSFFNSDDDLFGREEPDSENLIADIIESISVDVTFENNPFNGAELVISSKGVTIQNPINDTLSFTITEDNMKKINEPANWPFIPDIKIGFKQGDTLSFPKKFNAIEFAFKAKVRYRKDFF